MLDLKNFPKVYQIGKSVLFKKPRIVLVDLTYKCNCECVFCHADKSKRDLLSLEEWKSLLIQIKDWLGCVFIDFSGGEPLLNKDWFEILKHSNDIGLITGLSTNGSLVTESVAKKIMSLDINTVFISFYGTEKTQNKLMQRKNYSQIVSGVRNLLQARKNLSAKTKVFARVIIHNKNVTDIDEIISFIKKENLDGVVFRPLTFNHELMREYLKHDLWVKDEKKLIICLNKIKELKRSGYNVLNSYKNLGFIYDYYFSDSGLKNFGKGPCGNPFKRVDIFCDGAVRVCCLVLGNVRNSNIKNVYISNLKELNEISKNCKKRGLIGASESTDVKEKLSKACNLVFH